MRPDLRLRLREIQETLSTGKMGVSGVTALRGGVPHPVSHVAVTPFASEIHQQKQRVTPVAPATPSKSEVEETRHTTSGVTGRVTEGVAGSAVDLEDWLAHFDERAAIREYDGGFDRAEAERLALAETIATLGPKPQFH